MAAMKAPIAILLACTLTAMASDASDASRLRLVRQLAREKNDPGLVQQADDLGKALREAPPGDAEDRLRALESAVGLDAGGRSVAGQPLFQASPDIDEAWKASLPKLADAMTREDAGAVGEILAGMRQTLGDQAGRPDFRLPGIKAPAFTATEAQATAMFLQALDREKPTVARLGASQLVPDRMARFYASIVEACVTIRPFVVRHAAERLPDIDRLLRGTAGILLRLQQPDGHFPFPDLRGTDLRFGEMIDAQIKRHQAVIRDGWVVSENPDGGTQYDTGVCGTALLKAGAAMNDDSFRLAGLRAADWAISRKCCPNFNYNAFSISLLARAAEVGGRSGYRDAALAKFRLGLAPGQARNGRWLDPHNARTVYHVIILRALADLGAEAETRPVTDAAAAALLDEFDAMGITVEALPELLDLARLNPGDDRLRQAVRSMAASLVARCTGGGITRLAVQPHQLAAVAAACEWLAATTDGAASNLVRNPGFEESGRGWTLPATCAVAAGVARTGRASLHLRNTDPKTYLMARQTLPVETGACYRFRAWIRTRGVKGSGSGATVCAEWSGADGHLGGTYPGGRGGDQDWFLVEGLTPPMPTGATSLNLNLYLRKGMTGEAWFDDISVTEEMPRPIDCVLLQPNYRGGLDPAADAHSVMVRAKVGRRLACGLNPAATTLRLRVLAADGSEVASANAAGGAGDHDLVAEGVRLPKGRHLVRIDLLDPHQRILATEDLALVKAAPGTPPPAVSIDARNRTIADGKPFFPLGFYFGPGPADRDYTTHLDRLADSPFNTIMCYGINSGSLEAVRAYLDALAARKMKVIYSLKDIHFDLLQDRKAGFEQRWKDMLLVGREVKRLEPALLSTRDPKPVTVHTSEGVHHSQRADDTGRTYVLLANPDPAKEAETTVEVPRETQCRILDENGEHPAARDENGSVRLRLPAMGAGTVVIAPQSES